MATIAPNTLLVEREVIMPAATKLLVAGRLVEKLVGVGTDTPFSDLTEESAFYLVSRAFEYEYMDGLMDESTGAPKNEWAEVHARAEQWLAEWPREEA
jgi:hypothetical protein